MPTGSGFNLESWQGSTGIAPKVLVASTISKLSSAPGNLYMINGFTTAPTGAILRLYNATTGNVSQGSSNAVMLQLIGVQSTAVSLNYIPSPSIPTIGANFATACSLDVCLTATSTTATVAGNTYITYLYSSN